MASNTPKTMSSRLMTMKFMQRSAAKSTASSPSTPNGPPSKRVRLSSGGSAPGTPGTPDHEILQTALAAEEKKRQEALDKASQHTGETKWVLSFKDPLDGKRDDSLQVRHTGFAEIDAQGSSEEDEEEVRPIRKQFGGGVKRAEKPAFVETGKSEGEAESSSDDYDSDDPTAALIRETKREMAAESRASRNAQTRQGDKSPRGPAREPDGDMSVSGLVSLSGGRGPSGRGHGAQSRPRGSAGRGSGRGRGRARR